MYYLFAAEHQTGAIPIAFSAVLFICFRNMLNARQLTVKTVMVVCAIGSTWKCQRFYLNSLVDLSTAILRIQ